MLECIKSNIMDNEEGSLTGESNAPEFDKKAYQREYMRRKREADRAESNNPEMTATDKLFEEKKPGYWIWDSVVRGKECWMCGLKFETRLELNKFCSPKCKEEWLNEASRNGRKVR